MSDAATPKKVAKKAAPKKKVVKKAAKKTTKKAAKKPAKKVAAKKGKKWDASPLWLFEDTTFLFAAPRSNPQPDTRVLLAWLSFA